jgi:DNA repair exonuclease SbcCD nuclease subunit
LGYLIYVQDEQININEHITFTGVGEYGQNIGSRIEEVLRNNPLDQTKFNILALHGYLKGQFSDSIFDITGYQLASMGFNYIALGHYHKLWEEAENNIYCPGSTEQTSMNDWGKPDEDGFFRKAGFYSVKLSSGEENGWKSKVVRKEFPVRPKGRFTFKFDDTKTIEEIMKKANEFVEKHDLPGAVIRFDFVGKLPAGKQSLINFTKLPAVKNAKALHLLINQQVSSIILDKSKSGISSQEALVNILEKSYGFKKTSTPKWVTLVNETIKALGQKRISSSEADEAQAVYKLISELSSKIKDDEMTRVTKKKPPKKTIKVTTKKTATTKKPQKKETTQVDISQFFGGEK